MTLEVTVQLNDSTLDSEQAMLSSLNEAGSLATGEAFKRFDTNGSRLEMGREKWFSKGEVNKIYQRPTAK